jgi:DNA-binding NtrC family response regulator
VDKLVFIIDDDKVYLNFMKSHFKKMNGYHVEAYPGGDEALVELENKNPFLIILDHNLHDPSKNGIYFLKKIKKIKPKVPTLYITSDSSPAVQNDAMKGGAKCLIVKSESFLVQLRTAIDEINTPTKKGFLDRIFK